MAQARAALWTNDDVLEESAVHGACSRFLRQARARVAARPRRTVEVGESAVPRWQTLQRTDPWNCAYVFQRRPVVKLAESCTRFCALRIGSPDGGPVAPGLRLRSAAGGRRNAHTKSEPATRERPGLWHRRSEPSARQATYRAIRLGAFLAIMDLASSELRQRHAIERSQHGHHAAD